jgi:hypothetical protein
MLLSKPHTAPSKPAGASRKVCACTIGAKLDFRMLKNLTHRRHQAGQRSDVWSSPSRSTALFESRINSKQELLGYVLQSAVAKNTMNVSFTFVKVNCVHPGGPFGGFKQLGIGRELGEIRAVQVCLSLILSPTTNSESTLLLYSSSISSGGTSMSFGFVLQAMLMI